MSGKIIHAFGEAPLTELQKEMLERLDQVRNDVTTGRVTGVAFATMINTGDAGGGWVRQPSAHFALVGSLQSLVHRMLCGHEHVDEGPPAA